MTDNKKERHNGYTYTNKSVKSSIEKNEFVKNIRKKIMEERSKKASSD